MSNILLITNNNEILESFCKRLILLRSSDRVSCCDYEDGPDIIFSNCPDVVIVHEHEDFSKTINLIKYIRLQNCNVLLLINKYDRNNLLSAYDEGIDDYFSLKSDPSEIVIRIINCIKKKNTDSKLAEYKRYLEKYGILSGTTGFYTKKYAAEICEDELFLNDYSNGALTVIMPVDDEKTNSAGMKIASAIKNVLRFNDFVVNAGGSKFCILNRDYGVDGAVSIINNLKRVINGEFDIRAGVCEIKKYSYQTAEKKACCALSDALLSGREVVIYSGKNSKIDEEWLDVPVNANKNYKIFKQLFDRKLEKVITPVFYRMQKICEETFTNVSIEQYTDELQSIFRLSQNEHTSMLKLVYPGMTKVIISLTHSGLDSPENSEISINVNKITTNYLTEIMENFIGEFKTTV